MNILDAKNEIKNTVRAYLLKDDEGTYKIPAIRQRPILLMGPPGIGKTQIMEQISNECKIGLVSYTITHHTRQSAVGLPRISTEQFDGVDYPVTEYTMSEIIASIYRCIRDEGKREGILFIDEINCVSETLAPTMLQFLQCKTFGNQKVPEGWIIVAAGNPAHYNKSVREFDMVTLDRVRLINVEADFEVWKRYAAKNRIGNVIVSYLSIRPNNFYSIEQTVDGLEFVTARGWEDLSNLIKVYEELGNSVNFDVIYEFIRNEEIAEDFHAYYDMYRKYKDDYGIDDILQGNVEPKIYERILKADFDERLSVVNLILDGIANNVEAVEKMSSKADEWYEDILKRYPENEDRNEKFLDERKQFEQYVSCVEEKEKICRAQLENTFDFMENAFAESQEMVIFVTGLTIAKTIADFLLAYPCKRYSEYSEKYLMGNNRRNILDKLD